MASFTGQQSVLQLWLVTRGFGRVESCITSRWFFNPSFGDANEI